MEEEPLLLNHVEKQLDQLPIIRNTVQQNLQKEQQKQKDRTMLLKIDPKL
jgi:hypothetical protein